MDSHIHMTCIVYITWDISGICSERFFFLVTLFTSVAEGTVIGLRPMCLIGHTGV